ncbi:MAG: phosphatase PAP2 family protein [Candidatus Hodarchaeota archaeon]
MSENEILTKKLFLFILINIAAIFVVGLLLIFFYNTSICEFFYANYIIDKIFGAISFLGDTTFLILVMVTIWYVYDVRFAKNFALSILGSFYLNSLLKDIIQDPRPWTNASRYTDPGFPSGHAQQSVAGYAYLGYESYRKGKKYFSWIFVILVYLIAISRVILGVHYIQDIWGGLLIGILWLIFFILFEPKVSEIVDKFNFITKILISIIIPIVLFSIAILIFPTSESSYGLITGGIMGLSLGYVINKEYIGYDPRQITTKQKILNFIIGVVITLVLYLGLRYVPLDGQIWDFIRYIILAMILTTLVPWLFTKIQR